MTYVLSWIIIYSQYFRSTQEAITQYFHYIHLEEPVGNYQKSLAISTT